MTTPSPALPTRRISMRALLGARRSAALVRALVTAALPAALLLPGASSGAAVPRTVLVEKFGYVN